MEHKFQINLRGIIDLLSHHLYSGPEVFVRELLQNATDAIRARTKIDPAHAGDIHIEIHQAPGKTPSLVISENGIGLTPDEVHTFLSTIGLSSKRAAEGERPTDFIGQFGIGILSCFVVSDSIVVYSKSAKEKTPAVEWRAKPDGTYTIRELDRDLDPGTQVWLTAKVGCEEHFAPDRVRDLCRHYGGLLPYPIRITSGKVTVVANEHGAPWRQEYRSERERTRALMDFGRETFDVPNFLDAIPLRAKSGDVDGVAYVLPYAASLAAKRTHRVYLKNMLLSETAENLLPDWTFFVKAVVNANDLRPTAARESFYEDDRLAAARDELGVCLRRYLVELAEKDPRKLDRLIALHGLAIKALATQDEDFYKMVIDWLPFETSEGEMTFGEYRKQHDVVRYVPTVDQFRQVARVAQAHGLAVVNAGYTYDAELLARAEELVGVPTEKLDPSTLTHTFDELSLPEQEQTAEFLRAAETVLKPFRCEPEVKKYRPKELPALYTTTGEGRFFRSLEQSKEIANPLWSGVLDNLSKKERTPSAFAQLCFNFENALVRRLTTVRDRAVLHRSIQMLYLQSLLLGHHPLSGKEMQLLNDGLLALIEWGIGLQTGGEKE
ncbi:HSP90 family protein [Fimbriiglobus ruber]|uniref:Chaperone protein HtpG n=1 Tax=Fimbriiglobus ruber TaxID=1908690 RepID=A0A225EEE0_9BACT|nr:HSP90 family protein [Fimbriiglobus ruber]OWK46667.1 Chaperone protein HtpG [Fimbriiglobus ruber]